MARVAGGLAVPAPGTTAAAQLATEELAGELAARAGREGVSLVGPDGLLSGLTKTVLESALEAENGRACRLRAARPGRASQREQSQCSRPKMVLTEVGAVTIDVPRDRNGTFEPR